MSIIVFSCISIRLFLFISCSVHIISSKLNSPSASALFLNYNGYYLLTSSRQESLEGAVCFGFITQIS